MIQDQQIIRMDKKLEFFQINLHKAYAPTTELNNVLRKMDSFIAFIQEPVSQLGIVKGIDRKRGHIIHAINNDKIRAAIYCSKNITIQPLHHLSTKDLAAAMITVKKDGCDKNIVISSSYFPYDSVNDPPSQEFLVLTEYCKQNNLPMISGIDSNAHHLAWGSTNINMRGERLFEFIVTTELTILNVGNTPTFINKLRREVLDITVCTHDIALSIKEWKVSDHILTSDHECITFNLILDHLPPILFRNPASADWPLYTLLIEGSIANTDPSEPRTDKETDALAQSVQNILVEAYEKACPVKKHKAGNSVPYYSSKERKQRKIVRKEFNKCKRTGIWASYYEELGKYNKGPRLRERIGWKNQCSEINNIHDSAKMFKILSKNPTQSVGSLILPSGDYTKNLEETYTHLLNTNFPNCKIINHPMGATRTTEVEGIVNQSIIDRIITIDRIIWATKSFKQFKSPGIDKILPAMLQKVPEKMLQMLSTLFKASLKQKYIPYCWREANVIFIIKPGKSDYSLAENYRPISLTSFMLKTLEILVDRYLREEPLSISKIHEKQHAYQKGKSTINALHNMVQNIELSLSYNEYALACFIDISGAFNHITYRAITFCLTE